MDEHTPDTGPAVSTDGLSKTYGDRAAVDRVSMTVRRGEVYGFLGANGAGKTTTMRMLLGLVRPTAGTATVLGEPAGSPDVVARVGALVEGPGFFPYLSGRENLRVLARYRGLPDGDVDEALARVGLADRGGDAFRSYSLGMKQRLGVGSALMGDPELVVLDEPTNGLDPAGVQDMRRLVVDLAAEGRTVLLSSHQLAEVQQTCDRVGVVAGGRLVSESTVAELRGTARLVVEASPAATARRVVTDLVGDDRVEPDGDALVVAPAAGDDLATDLATTLAPRLVRALVDAEVDVRRVTVVERSLEDVFFEITAAEEAA